MVLRLIRHRFAGIFKKRWIELLDREATRMRKVAVSLLLIGSSVRATSVEEVPEMPTISIIHF